MSDERTGRIAVRKDGVFVKFEKNEKKVNEVKARSLADAYELLEYWVQTGIVDDSVDVE